MVYSSDKPENPSADDLRARIPGWGADLDPADRPSAHRQLPVGVVTGAHWDFPERQDELVPRERSIEHRFLTPVFGTAAPLHGVSGAIRGFAYARFSEARAAHWLLLLGGDRVDAIGGHLKSLVTLHPDNPFTETGVISEVTHHGISSRFGRNRVDLSHVWMDPLIIAGPWVLAGVALYRVLRRKK